MADELVLQFKTVTNTSAAQAAIGALERRVESLTASISRAMSGLNNAPSTNPVGNNRAALDAAQLAAAQARAATAAQAQTAAQNRAAASAVNLGASQTRAATATQVLTAAQARAATATTNLGTAQARQAVAQAAAARGALALAAAQNRAAGGGSNLSSGLNILHQQLGGINSALPISVTGTGALAGGVVTLAIAAVRSATELDSLKRGLVAVSGSSTQAEEQLVRLREVAKLPGLSFREAIEGSIRLQAAGVSAELAERALKGFGNALATIGKGSAELEGVTRALSQIQSKGKVQAEEINQLAERLPQIRVLMQEAFGTARTEDIQKLNLSSSEFLERIVEQLEKMPQVTGGAQTAFENLQDAAFIALTQIGNELLPSVLKAVGDLTGYVENNGNAWRELGRDMAGIVDAASSAISAIRAVGDWLGWLQGVLNAGADMGHNAFASAYPRLSLLLESAHDNADAALGGGSLKPKRNPYKGTKYEQQMLDPTYGGVPNVSKKYAGSGLPKKGGGGRKAKDTSQKELQDRMRLLDLELRAVESNLDREVDANDRAYALRIASLEEYTIEAIRLENERWQKQREVLLKQIADISAHDKDREIKVREFSLKLVEAERQSAKKIQEVRDERDRKEQEARRTHAEGVMRIQEAGDKNQIARINELAENRALSAEQAESKIAEIELTAFYRRRKLLQDDIEAKGKNKEDARALKDQLGLMEVELTGIVEEQNRRKRAARQSDLDDAREYQRTLLRLERDAAEIGRDTTRAILDARLGRSRGGGEARRQVAERLRLAKEEIDARHEIELDALNEDEWREIQRVGFAEAAQAKRLEIYEKYHHLRVEQRKRHEAETKEAESEAESGTFTGQVEGALGTDTDAFKTGADFEGFGQDAIISGINATTAALEDGVAAWLLYGDSIAAALKKALAAEAAKVAAGALLQAALHAAYAVGNLAFGNFGAAGKHAIAAAKFGAVAAIAGVAARALSGGGASSGAGSGTTAEAEQGRQVQYAPFNYGGGAQPSSAVAQDGSRNIWGRLTAAVERLESMPAGQVVTMGAPGAVAAIGAAVSEHSASDYSFNQDLMNNLGVA